MSSQVGSGTPEPEWVARLEEKLDEILDELRGEPEAKCPRCDSTEMIQISDLSGIALACGSCGYEFRNE